MMKSILIFFRFFQKYAKNVKNAKKQKVNSPYFNITQKNL